jgi:hypothetical protein
MIETLVVWVRRCRGEEVAECMVAIAASSINDGISVVRKRASERKGIGVDLWIP